MASSLKDSVLHWRKKLERTDDESVMLNVIHKLSKVPVTVELLQDTGIGKIIRSLAKKSGKVGVKATTVLHNWRELVSSAQKSPDNFRISHSKHNSSKSQRKEREDTHNDKSHKKSTSHERQSAREIKSLSFNSKQHLITNDHSKNNSNHHSYDLIFPSNCQSFNSTSKSSNTDESEGETLFFNSYPGKRKSLETSPSNIENYVSETKRLKMDPSFSLYNSSQHKNKSDKQSQSDNSNKKKDKEKKSHDFGVEIDFTIFPTKNSHSHNGLSKNSEVEKTASKKSKKNKDMERKKQSGIKAIKMKPIESFTSSEARFEDCLNFSDIVPLKKKKSSHKNSLDKKEKHKTTEKEKHKEILDKKGKNKEEKQHTDKKEKHKHSSNKNVEKLNLEETVTPNNLYINAKLSPTPALSIKNNPLPSLLSDSTQKSLPKLNEVDILSTLPQIQPNYRPLPQRNFDPGMLPIKKKVLTNEDAIKFTSSRKERTSVYSGRKNLFYTEMPTLFECCTRVLIENIDAIEYLGEVPYFLLKTVLERCTPLQLYNIEDYNPYLLNETHELWEVHCKRDFRAEKLQENETWRDLYLRAFEERDKKLKNITANISSNMIKSGPARQVKLAYVNTVAKPPRDVARKQAKMGTALPVNHTVKAGPSTKATPRPTAPAINSAASSSKSEYSIPKKPKVAPLMAKTLKSMKQCYRR